jgi:MoxR-like ATPase
VTVDGTTYRIEPPFLVLATQNPVESEGTYALPEAQLDRFMMKLLVDYPTVDEEADVLRLHLREQDVEQQVLSAVQPVVDPAGILECQRLCRSVTVGDKVVDYVNALVRKTRDWKQFYLGASPRAGISLINGARALAAFDGRSYAVPDDVVELAIPVLRHRVILSPESEVEGRTTDEALKDMVRTIEVPRL